MLLYNTTSLLSTVFWETEVHMFYSTYNVRSVKKKKANFYLQCQRLEVFTAVKMLIVLWDVMHIISIFRVEPFFLQPRPSHFFFTITITKSWPFYLPFFLFYPFPLIIIIIILYPPYWLTTTLKMEVICFSKMLVTTCKTLMSHPRTPTKDTISKKCIWKQYTPNWSIHNFKLLQT